LQITKSMQESTPEYKKIPYENLVLDRENPRIPKSRRDNISEAEIIEFMLLEAATLELMIAIGENGFFAGEQLLVVKNENGKYTVVEGNRRLTAVKLLHEPELARHVQKSKIARIIAEVKVSPITEIPCLVFNSKEVILKYLGFRHITGVKSWRMLEKARYLHGLKERNFSDVGFYTACRSIAKMIGSRRDYVSKVLVGFELFKVIEDNDFYGIRDLDDTRFYFNYLKDSLNYSNIQKFWGISIEEEKENPVSELNYAHLKETTHWFFEKNRQNKSRVLGDSKGLKMLNAVIGTERALAEFRGGASIEKSFEMTSDLEILFEKRVQNSLLSLEEADAISHRIKRFYPDLEDDLGSIRKLTMKIKNLKDSLRDEEDF